MATSGEGSSDRRVLSARFVSDGLFEGFLAGRRRARPGAEVVHELATGDRPNQPRNPSVGRSASRSAIYIATARHLLHHVAESADCNPAVQPSGRSSARKIDHSSPGLGIAGLDLPNLARQRLRVGRFSSSSGVLPIQRSRVG